MLRVERNTSFQMACQNIRAQTCNVNFSLHRLATDTDLTKQMKWFRNSSVPDKYKPHAFSDRTYSEIRMRGIERQRTFAGFDTSNESEKDFSVSGTKVDISDSKEKSSKSKVWSQDMSRLLPSVSECFTPPSLPSRPPPKRHDSLRKSNTAFEMSTGPIKFPPRPETRERPVTRERGIRERPVTREQNMHDRPITRECKTRGRKRDDDGMNDKLPSIIQEEPMSERDKGTQTSAKRPPGGWKSIKDEPKSSRSTRSRVSSKGIENLGPTPKFLPEVQNTRDNCRRNESNLPVEPLPNIFTPATAPGVPFEKHNNIENLTAMYNVTPDTATLTPANTLDSSVLLMHNQAQRQGTSATESSLTFSSQTLTPLERSASVKVRRAPVPFRTKVTHKVFLA